MEDLQIIIREFIQVPVEVLVEMLDRARVLVDGVKIIYESLIVENCMLIVTCSGTAVVVDSSFEVTKKNSRSCSFYDYLRPYFLLKRSTRPSA